MPTSSQKTALVASTSLRNKEEERAALTVKMNAAETPQEYQDMNTKYHKITKEVASLQNILKAPGAYFWENDRFKGRGGDDRGPGPMAT